MKTLILKHFNIRPSSITDLDDFASLWAGVTYITSQNITEKNNQ